MMYFPLDIDLDDMGLERGPVLPANPCFTGAAQETHDSEPLSRCPEEIDPQTIAGPVKNDQQIFFSHLLLMLDHLARDWPRNQTDFWWTRVKPDEALAKSPTDPKLVIEGFAVSVDQARVQGMVLDLVVEPRQSDSVEVFNWPGSI